MNDLGLTNLKDNGSLYQVPASLQLAGFDHLKLRTYCELTQISRFCINLIEAAAFMHKVGRKAGLGLAYEAARSIK